MYKFIFTAQIIAIVATVLLIKYIVHFFDLEFIEEYPLMAALITTDVFILGFLINGVYPDYKQAEKLPMALRTNITTLSDSLSQVGENPKKIQQYIYDLTVAIIQWFYKQIKLPDVLRILLSYPTQSAKSKKAAMIEMFQTQTKQIQEILSTIHHMRNERFIQTGYLIVDVMTLFVIIGLIFLDTPHVLESFFYTGIFSFSLIFMVFLLRDLDNPFSHYKKEKIEEVSLQPLYELRDELKKSLRKKS